MKLNLLAAVASVALLSSDALAQDNARHEERPGAAKSEAAPVQGLRAEPAQAPRAAQTNERGEQGAPRAAQTEGQRAEPPKAKAETAAPNRAAEPNGGEAKGRNERAHNGAERQEPRSAEHPEKQAPARTGATEQRQDERNKTGSAEQQGERSKTGAAEQRQGERTKTGAAEQRNGENRGASAEGRGQPRVVGNVRTSPEHASRATEILMRSGRRESVNIDVRVGVRVPETVTILPVPEEVITFAPEYRGYDYFIENDEIVFVSPSTHEVVGMIEYEGRAAATDVTRVRAARPCPTED